MEIPLWIAGRGEAASGGGVFESRRPEDDGMLATAARGTAADIDRAVRAAESAFAGYRETTPGERERWLLGAAEGIEDARAALVELLIDEVGSPLGKARKEIATACGLLRAAAGATRQLSGKTLPSDVPGRWSLSIRQPRGVVAGMTPFNVPLIKNVKHSAMPLATGNTVVLLPSEHAPAVAGKLAEIYAAAGFPAGTFNVVTGFGEEIGDALTGHPLVRCVTLTGSPRVGRHVAALCGAENKPYLLELGGKNPLVVCEDADVPAAVGAAVLGSFLYQGQICMASSRIYVAEALYPSFVEQLSAAASRLSLGPLNDPQTMIGPIISRRQRERIVRHLDEALAGGAQLRCGGQWHGNRLTATVLTDVPADCEMHRHETFGPVTAVYPVGAAEEALTAVNDSPYGLSAAIFTRDLAVALDFARRCHAGMVHVNGATVQDEPHVPFGGVGESGFGRESTDADLEIFTEWKWITLQA